MKSVLPGTRLGSEFDAFLFSPLGEDRNGLLLTIVSVFARMDLDPWQEAGSLAALPAEAAARRLGLALETLTDATLRQIDSAATVRRLLALLPRRGPAADRRPVAGIGAVTAPDPRTRIRTIFFIASAVVLVGSQILSAHRFAPSQPPVASQTLPAPPGH